ncbi:FIG056333: sensor [hydrothermal vent metagenome]|uniref:histidine kinase n=1 Tax=hydrothermal vent metagenome TaxID=652676 RepID=A0A3B0U4L7_9ZZZZ
MGAWFFHKGKGTTALFGAVSSFFAPGLAFAQPVEQTLASPDALQSLLLESSPLAIGAGALGFGIVAAFWVIKTRREIVSQQRQSQRRIALMRAKLDEYEALLNTIGEVTILWAPGATPEIFGEIKPVFPQCNSISRLLDFPNWLIPEDARKLKDCLALLAANGQSFKQDITTLDGRALSATGRAIGGATALRLRIASQGAVTTANPVSPRQMIANAQDGAGKDIKLFADNAIENIKAVLAIIEQPAWIRNNHNVLVFANKAYLKLAKEMGLSWSEKELPEIFPASQIAQHRCELERTGKKLVVATQSEHLARYKVSLSSIRGVVVGCLIGAGDGAGIDQNSGMVHIGGVIDALTTPVAVFDHKGHLTQFNQAYARLWHFDDDWLQYGVNERAIIDHLRRRDLLPSVPDYQAWRKRHFQYYSSLKSWEDCWHLPDGRAINVIAAPASSQGGMIYVFEDVSERLKLVSTNKALINVQRETLNALSEGVAVFSTDGRLRLHNPRLSAIWKLPMNELGRQPHINGIAQACGRNLSADGEQIWLEMKQFIVDLNPSRSDKSGRVSLSDGRLIDYAIVRLPDSQTMLTFVDVTRSAQYEQVLKERNDALVTADRLKDAFIQNVSYELRSPLTNIIGFADLLVSDSFGELNEQQRAYTDYIRASSTTLGILIDNILDLTHVDAGIAELDLKSLDIAQLIEKAKAGLAASFAGVNGEQRLNLKVHLPEKLPLLIADGSRIVQILYNLLSNAAKFSAPGARVDLSVEARGDWIRFIVEDEGAGVPDEMVGALFQRFEGQSVEGRQRGAGLGLTIVNAFVELHGGNLNIEAREPNGTRVIVNLPADATPYVVSPATALLANNNEQ